MMMGEVAWFELFIYIVIVVIKKGGVVPCERWVFSHEK